LSDEIGDKTTVVDTLSGTIGVEYASYACGDVPLTEVFVCECFGYSFAFVVTGAGANGVDVAPVGFGLRVLFWIAVNFGG
jgi:hypothetical protein